jgi:hypothetical protein
VTEEFWRPIPPAKRSRKGPRVHRNNTRNNRKAKPGGPSQVSKQMLGILTLLVMQGRYRMYEGTANPKQVAKRHAKNKVARQSRKVNRNG